MAPRRSRKKRFGHLLTTGRGVETLADLLVIEPFYGEQG
jgi:hypothetical protein